MKLLVTLALACALFSKVYPLDCYECKPTGAGPCSQTTKTCPASQTECGSGTVVLSAGEILTELRGKSCAAPAECHCLVPPNGKKCFTCVGDDCTSTLQCIGPEDRCIKSSVTVNGQKVTKKGCVSKTICSGSLNSQLGAIAVDLSCCEGDMCNNALRIGQSILFLLLVPLASFILFN
ncbi:hypothetical protein SKAU_G00416520 [Synaphobranchus kaupii]|uniref:UPAR/Ly6 domain-containing protein n=1 Tax=Synaphobranchus kaupii TaxID=118154 RepID=A0A9Q1E5R8_SYNKA|nr:hypothetical protein SKAU_G00416520 [Synaphobranchus kaupii]